MFDFSFFFNFDVSTFLLIMLAGLYAGTQNTIAGGGSFITFPALLLAGLDPLAANITSTLALYPNQISSCIAGRKLAAGAGRLSLKLLFILSCAGGLLGGLLLLNTPISIFSQLVPWLVLFATLVFALGSFRKKPLPTAQQSSPGVLACIQFLIGVYGGYFGGGIGILMLASLTIAGQAIRIASATKNMLAMAMNTSAVILFVNSTHVNWGAAFALSIGGVGGAFLGHYLLQKLPEKIMRGFVVLVGLVLSIWLFVR